VPWYGADACGRLMVVPSLVDSCHPGTGVEVGAQVNRANDKGRQRCTQNSGVEGASWMGF
jgi:hypothetical protein